MNGTNSKSIVLTRYRHWLKKRKKDGRKTDIGYESKAKDIRINLAGEKSRK